MHPRGRRRGRRRRTGSHLRDATPHPGQQAFHRLPVPDHSSILSHTYCLRPNTAFKDPSRHFCSYAPNHRHHGKPTHTYGPAGRKETRLGSLYRRHARKITSRNSRNTGSREDGLNCASSQPLSRHTRTGHHSPLLCRGQHFLSEKRSRN